LTSIVTGVYLLGDPGPCVICNGAGYLVQLWGEYTYSCWRHMRAASELLRPSRHEIEQVPA
jgi:hypothetical protein